MNLGANICDQLGGMLEKENLGPLSLRGRQLSLATIRMYRSLYLLNIRTSLEIRLVILSSCA